MTDTVLDPDGNTSIIIKMKTRDELSDCKHGKDTYDSVIQRLMRFHHKITGTKIVE